MCLAWVLLDVTINERVGQPMQRITQFLHLLVAERGVSEDAPTLCDTNFGHNKVPRESREAIATP